MTLIYHQWKNNFGNIKVEKKTLFDTILNKFLIFKHMNDDKL